MLKEIVVGAGLAATVISCAIGAAKPIQVTIDWNRPTGKANRALFSMQGFMQAYVEPNPKVLETFKLLNPEGTQTRLEIWVHRMEPENDNADPIVFNWEKLDQDRMIRFIEDREPFLETVSELGMEPLALLGYTAEWLRDEKGNRVDYPEEWTEFAAAVVETFNGSGQGYRPNLILAQLWNEPNFHFWEGTDEDFFELYNMAAERLHRDYPGVMIGGPTLTNAGENHFQYAEEFLENCGEQTDYFVFHHYGPMGEGVQPIIDSLDRYLAMYRSLPGKENAKAMITETDAWFEGREKQQFMMERQFAFIERSDDLLSVHHFCVMAYNESGNYEFGMINDSGGVIEGTFWPYWLFRNWAGDTVYAFVNDEGESGVLVAASIDQRAGKTLATAVLHNSAQETQSVNALMMLPELDAPLTVTIERLTGTQPVKQQLFTLPAGSTKLVQSMELQAGESAAVHVMTQGERHFAFADLNNQEAPWVTVTSPADRLMYQGEADVTVIVMNTLPERISGSVRLAGMPEGWRVEPKGNTQYDLDEGERKGFDFTVYADSYIREPETGIYAVADSGSGVPDSHSIPHRLFIDQPVEAHAAPQAIRVIPGVDYTAALQLKNNSETPVTGYVSMNSPAGVRLATQQFEHTIPAKSVSRAHVRFQVDQLLRSETTLSLGFSLDEITIDAPVTLIPVKPETDSDLVMVNLSDHFNFDPVASAVNKTDYTQSMGMFIFPNDFLPTNRIVNTGAMSFQMGDLSDGIQNALMPQGQKIELPVDYYQKIHFLGFGHDGKHPGTWIAHYADGTTDQIQSEIPEWCVAPPEGTIELFPTPMRYTPTGLSGPPCQLWWSPVDINSSKQLAAIEMPTFENAYLFAITLEKAQ